MTNLGKAPQIRKLTEALNGPEVPSLGKLWTNKYRESYIDYLEAGGELCIQPSVTSSLLYKLLQSSPIMICVCDNTLYGTGKTVHMGSEKTALDAVKGRATNHTLVIYGNDEAGNFLVADPWYKPGLNIVDPERMLCAISTAQMECDNLLFQLKK